jgi:hypothetical protein
LEKYKNKILFQVLMTDKLKSKEVVEKNIKNILPEKYRFLDEYESMKKHFEKKLKIFTPDELGWSQKTFTVTRKNKLGSQETEVNFIETMPEICHNKHCTGFLFSILENPGIKISEIAFKMGNYTRAIQRAREKLEKVKLIVVHKNAFRY